MPLIAALCLCSASLLRSPLDAYDPLAVPAASKARTLDLTVHDASRSRDIPIKVYLPNGNSPAAVVLFSHGLGGSREGSKFLGEHWSARRYVAVFVQHPGSDESVWRGKPLAQVMPAMKKAASGENFLLRVKDVPAVLDQLAKWNRQPGHALSGRLDMGHIGMSGHSFGAITTQAVSGESMGGRKLYTDPRIKASVIFSPSEPRAGRPESAFGSVTIPWMLMTGTQDVSPIGDIGVEQRLSVYPALPTTIDRYELVLFDAQHGAFTDAVRPGAAARRNPNHHRAILALSTAFWDANLKGDSAARAWLNGDRVCTVLESNDRWQVGLAK
jgi:dienelactone hydrolase